MTYAGEHTYHANRLVSIFGGAETWMELSGLLEWPAFTDAVAEYGRVHAATPKECASMPESLTHTLGLRWSVAKLAAFASGLTGDDGLASRAWELLFAGDGFGTESSRLPEVNYRTVPDACRGTVQEASLTTNHSSQWALNVIAALAQTPEALDAWWEKHGGRLWPAEAAGKHE
jgi:hypothetical protein